MSIKGLPEVKGQYRYNAEMAKFSWFGVGGKVDVLYKPADIDDLAGFLQHLPEEIPYFVFGVASNLLLSDAGYRGVAIRLGREFNYTKLESSMDESYSMLKAGAASLDVNVAEYACINGIVGLEFLSGIPGTIGGAIAMNAGAYGREVSEVLLSAKGVSRSGEVREFGVEQMGYEYRKSNIAKDWIFVEGVFRAEPGAQDEIRQRMQSIQEKRSSTQPIKSKTCGSTFKNPDGYKAWELIDKAGCRGMRVGGAYVSELHCNFLINGGYATASDLIQLVNEIKKRVHDKFGVTLEEEIKII